MLTWTAFTNSDKSSGNYKGIKRENVQQILVQKWYCVVETHWGAIEAYGYAWKAEAWYVRSQRKIVKSWKEVIIKKYLKANSHRRIAYKKIT